MLPTNSLLFCIAATVMTFSIREKTCPDRKFRPEGVAMLAEEQAARVAVYHPRAHPALV